MIPGEWIGNAWCGYRAGASQEERRLTRKLAVLRAHQDRCRSGAMVRLWCAYGDAAEIVRARILDLRSAERLAA